MAREKYDVVGGLERLIGSLNGLDPRTPDIIASHIALEREIEVVLSRSLYRPHHIVNLNYAQKVRVLAATWKGEDTDADHLLDALLKFGTLRNKVAHGNSSLIDESFRHLRTAYQKLQPDEIGLSASDIAGGIIAFFGDGPTPTEIRAVSEGIEHLWETADESAARQA